MQLFTRRHSVAIVLALIVKHYESYTWERSGHFLSAEILTCVSPKVCMTAWKPASPPVTQLIAIGSQVSLRGTHRMMKNFELDKILFDLKLDIAVEGTHKGPVIADSCKSSTHDVIDRGISPESHLSCPMCRPLCALFLSFLSLESIIEYLNLYWFLLSVEFEFERWQIHLLPSSSSMCRWSTWKRFLEAMLRSCWFSSCVIVSEREVRMNSSIFRILRNRLSKKLMVVVGAWVWVFWTLFDRWFVTVCQFSSLSLFSLSVSTLSSIFTAVVALACCPVAISSVCLTVLTTILVPFDPPFGQVGEGESFSALPISRKFVAHASAASVNEETNWFEERKTNWKKTALNKRTEGKMTLESLIRLI